MSDYFTLEDLRLKKYIFKSNQAHFITKYGLKVDFGDEVFLCIGGDNWVVLSGESLLKQLKHEGALEDE